MCIVNGMKDVRGVLVLMSTYNGARWLREQLDSVLSQEGVDVSILVRDDGSTDKTVTILEEYAQTHDNVSFYLGPNKGVVGSFNDLLANEAVDNYEYVAFCDQDDVWLPFKLKRAIKMIPHWSDIPCLYCSQLAVVDQDLNHIKYFYEKTPQFDCYTAMVQNCATGCTEMFNHRAVELYREGIGSRMEMHDYWMFLVCLCMGEVYWDSESAILYRQHGDNVVGAKKKSVLTALAHYNKSGCREQMVRDFDGAYSCKMAEETRTILLPLIKHKHSLVARIRLFFNPQYHGYSAKVTANFKVRTLINRLY